jgi:hypothetical protein
MWKYTAVIIEPRKHKALEFVLRNFIENLSDEWKILIFHGKQNKEFIQEIILRNDFENRIDKLIQLDVDNLTIAQYNRILINYNFYNCILTELFLIFQTDTLILSKNKELINEFLEYDYVGSPWYNSGLVGNGGLSLRRKSKMIEVCKMLEKIMMISENQKEYILKILDKNNEDVLISQQEWITLNKPDMENAKRFGMETIYSEQCFGIHCIWKYITKTQLETIIKNHPEVKILMELNRL